MMMPHPSQMPPHPMHQQGPLQSVPQPAQNPQQQQQSSNNRQSASLVSNLLFMLLIFQLIYVKLLCAPFRNQIIH